MYFSSLKMATYIRYSLITEKTKKIIINFSPKSHGSQAFSFNSTLCAQKNIRQKSGTFLPEPDPDLQKWPDLLLLHCKAGKVITIRK
jgi:hypothetical protein